VADQHVVTLGADGHLLCLELATGKKVWEANVNEKYGVKKSFFGVTCSPIVEGNLVCINVGGPGAGVVAFDLATGKEVWKATDQEASNASPVAATINGERQLLFFTREGLLSVAPATGQVRFSKRWRPRINASVNAATPLVIGGQVFISTSYDTGSLLLEPTKDGLKEVWKSDEALTNHYNTSVHHRGQLFGIHGRQEHGAELRCIDLATGKVRWSKERFGCASLIRVGEQVLALTEKGELVLFDASADGYREAARAKILGDTCRAHPALANGRLYSRDTKKLVCVDLRKQ
jgi:outer membrane protein assembly factor BamB